MKVTSPADVIRRGARSPRAWHVTSLVGAGLFLIVVVRHQWFYFDEWAFLVPSNDGKLFEPHVGHWSTTPILVTHALRAVFGLTTYWPYILLSLATHVLICHLLWRIMRRVGVNDWIATALALLLALLGAGAENILWAFQFGFMGAIALGLLVILLVDDIKLSRGRWVAVIALSIWSLTFSGTAIPVLMAAGLLSLVRRGFAKTAAMFAPAGVIYIVWYAIFARGSNTGTGVNGISQLGIDVPQYVGHVFVDGLGTVMPFEGFGAIAVFVLIVWFAMTMSAWRGPAAAGYCLAGAALVQAILTALTRVNLGVETASSGRYIYAAVALLLPAVGLCFTWFSRGKRPIVILMVIFTLFTTAYNATLLAREANSQGLLEQATRQQLSAALTLINRNPSSYESAQQPEPVDAPDITVGDLSTMYHDGWIQIEHFDEGALLTAQTNLDVRTESVKAEPAGLTCSTLSAGATETTRSAATYLSVPSKSGATVFLTKGRTEADHRPLALDSGWTKISSDPGLTLVVSVDSTALVCN